MTSSAATPGSPSSGAPAEASGAAPTPEHLVLYDGVCGLCDRTVQILLSLDRRGVLSYAPLQGETAAAILERQGVDDSLDSLIHVHRPGTEAERLSVRSRAVLAILRALGGFWRLPAALGRLVPRALADRLYDFVAGRRYRWFGRFDACRLPPSGSRHRFLD